MPRARSLRRRSARTFSLLVAVIAMLAWFAALGLTADRLPSFFSSAASKPTAKSTGVDRATQQRVREAYGQLPLAFEANVGQTDTKVNYFSRGPGYNMFLTPTEAVLVFEQSAGREPADVAAENEANPEGPLAARALRLNEESTRKHKAAIDGTVVRMQLIGANNQPRAVVGDEQLPGKVNYLFGNDQSKWLTGVPTYAKVKYESVYPGVDLVYYGNGQQLEYDFVVAPGASPDQISINFDGAQSVRMDGEGNLVLKTGGGELRQQRPLLYQQEPNGERTLVGGQYVPKGGNRIGFKVSKYDRRKPLVIDPILSYSSFINTSGEGIAIAVDPSGNAYITGQVFNNQLVATPGAFQIAFGGTVDAFVTKINQAGDRLLYSTYLGGSGEDGGLGIAVDAAGSAYVTGYAAAGFPTTAGAYQTTPRSSLDAFLMKLNPAGSGLIFSTFLGGNDFEEGDVVAVDPADGGVYVVGGAISPDFPTTPGAYRTTPYGGFDGFAAKFNASGTSLLYSTFLGGSGLDFPIGATIDGSGNVYIAGETASLDFPTQSAFQSAHAGAARGIFKSTNAGGSWSLSRNNLPTTYVYSIAVKPDDSNTIIIGTDGGIYKSTDGGGSWSRSFRYGVVRQLLYAPGSSNTIYAGTEAGVLKTTDGGNNWAVVNNGLVVGSPSFVPQVRGLVINPSDTNTLYVNTIGGGVYKTTNAGSSWAQVNSGLPQFLTTSAQTNGIVLDPSAPNTLYVAVANTANSPRIYKTTNGGASWSAAATGLPNNAVTTLAINPATPSTVYAGTAIGIYRTTNGGSSWSAANNGLNVPRSDGSTLVNPQINAIAIDPVTPSTLYAGPSATASANGSAFSFSTVFKSADGGNNWTAQSSGFNNLNNSIASLAIDPTNPSNVYTGNFGDLDGFVLKLNSTGDGLSFSTFLGGDRFDLAAGVALDNANNVYVLSRTSGGNFPVTAGAFQTALKGFNDIAVTKLDASGAFLIYSTLLGGTEVDNTLGGIAVDQFGSAYVTGETFAADFPVTAGAFQRTIGNRGIRNSDAFVAKLNPAGTGLDYASYLGGGGDDVINNFFGNHLALDAFGNAYLVGTTNSTNFPAFDLFGSTGTIQTYVAKIEANTSSYSITGRLTATGTGTPIANHFLDIFDARGYFRSAQTDAQGYYAFISLPAGDYRVVPGQFGSSGQFAFTPAERVFTNLNSDQNADFTGSRLYQFQGRVTNTAGTLGVRGVTITISGSASATVVTDASGFFHFFDGFAGGGNYTITPSRAGYTFNPANRTVTNLSADQFNLNFTTPTAQFFNLSGRITNGGAGVNGARVSLTGATQTSVATNANGDYLFPNLQADETYNIIPSFPQLRFTPELPTLSNFAGPQTVNFTASAATDLAGAGKLAFERFNFGPGGNGSKIFSINANSTSETNLSNNSFDDSDPGWSPDGSKLVFDSFRGGTTDDLYTMNADGTNVFRLVTDVGEDGGSADWSPDGSTIIFQRGSCSSAEEMPLELFTVNPDGTNVRRLTNNLVADGLPDYKPDGTAIVFTSTTDTDCSTGEADLYTIDAAGGSRTQLTNTAGISEYEPVWSPDGSKLAFIRESFTEGVNDSFRADLYMMNADGSNLINLTPKLRFVFSPTWSPDGTKLAFDGSFLQAGSQIFVVNADGTGLVQITTEPQGGGSSFHPAWRPDLSMQSANLGGRIVETNGVPLAGATVTLSGSQSGQVTTDAAGFYAFRNIGRGGNYTVTATAPGRTFGTPARNFNNLTGTGAANFVAIPITFSISGRITDASNPGVGLSNVTVTLTGAQGGTFVTGADGNYSFNNLAPGGNYTVTPARANYEFEPASETFNNLSSHSTANFDGTLVYTISGRITDGANGAGLADVTVTVSGTRTVIRTTNQNGDFSVTVAAAGTYSVTPSSPYFTFAPPRADFVNLSAPQTANFVTLPNAVPTPTPPISDNFNGAVRDPAKFNLGAISQDPASVDPLIPVIQRNGRLEITPRVNEAGERYNGYVTVRSFDFTSATASVEVVQAATSTAETIFGLGEDRDNNYRFVVTTAGNPAVAPLVRARIARGDWPTVKLEATMMVLVFQIRVNGVVTQHAIPYDPVQHRFWRFRHEAPVNSILFETSPDSAAYTERFRQMLSKGVSTLAAELTAGTAVPTTGGGTAVYDNFNLSTSSMQFAASTLGVVEGATNSAVISVTRTGNIAGAATVDYATVDNPAAVPCDPTIRQPDGTPYPQGPAYARCDYATSLDTLRFEPNQVERTLTIPLIDDAHAEGDETLRIILRNPTGAGLSAAVGVITLTISDNDQAGAPNPVNTTPFFVRQQYLDFLSREPEAGEPWSAILNGCPNVFNLDPQDASAACDRIIVSQSFFGSPEFRLKGFFVYNFYSVAFNRLPEYAEIIPDMRVVTGRDADDLFAKRAAYPVIVTQRAEFKTLYDALSHTAYVNALLDRYQLQQITTPDPQNPEGGAQVTLTRSDLVTRLGATGGQALTRAQVLRAIVESGEVGGQEFNRAFVAMQYYGYLRRKPEEGGYQAWLRVINQDPNNVRVMVNGFMNSSEYRLRFGRS